MRDIKLTIDACDVTGNADMTILDVARQADIHIPTLCHHPELTPDGVCRICVVEVEGSIVLIGACHTKIVEGMVVHTHSPSVVATRKVLVELLMTAHTGTCVNDTRADSCELHNLAADLEVGQSRFQVRQPRSYPTEIQIQAIQRDLSRCILCRKCVRACDEIAKKGVLSVGYRGFRTKIITGLDEPLYEEACGDCGICIDYCPTGALSRSLYHPEKEVAGRDIK